MDRFVMIIIIFFIIIILFILINSMSRVIASNGIKPIVLLLDLDRKLNIGIFDNHNEMIRFAESEGIFYKPSGSGGGDLGLLISNESLRIEEVCEILDSRGLNYFQV